MVDEDIRQRHLTQKEPDEENEKETPEEKPEVAPEVRPKGKNEQNIFSRLHNFIFVVKSEMPFGFTKLF